METELVDGVPEDAIDVGRPVVLTLLPTEEDVLQRVSLEEIIWGKVDAVLSQIETERKDKFAKKEQENLEQKISWRTTAGKPSNDRETVETYCRARWPLCFEKDVSDELKSKADSKIEKAMEKRVMYEIRAASYFVGGSELDMIAKLVEGANAGTGLLGAKLNKTINRFDVLHNYFSQPNIALKIETEDDYTRLVALRDRINEKADSYYWKKKLYTKEGNSFLKLKAQEIVRHMDNYILEYEQKRVGDFVEKAIEQLILKPDYAQTATLAVDNTSSMIQKELDRIEDDLAKNIAAIMQNDEAEGFYKGYAGNVMHEASEGLNEARGNNGGYVSQVRRNRILRESIISVARKIQSPLAKKIRESYNLVMVAFAAAFEERQALLS